MRWRARAVSAIDGAIPAPYVVSSFIQTSWGDTLLSEPVSARRVARFGVFEADLEAGELRREGRRVPLQELPFQVLAALLEQSGREVSREDLRRRLWPDREFLDFENGINTAVGRLPGAGPTDAEQYRSRLAAPLLLVIRPCRVALSP